MLWPSRLVTTLILSSSRNGNVDLGHIPCRVAINNNHNFLLNGNAVGQTYKLVWKTCQSWNCNREKSLLL
jgi:hypothetical protein